MSAHMLKRVPLTVVRALGRGLGIAIYAFGVVFRSQSLRVLGLPCVAESNFRRGNLDRASSRAIELLRLAKAEPNDWNCGNAIHKGHLMLGRVALARGELDLAGAELIASARVPGSPQLGSFGPNMQLALGLLQAGRNAPVLEFFRLCDKFWEMGRPQLRTWSADVENGRLPMFGGNLLY